MNEHRRYVLSGREVVPADLLTWERFLASGERRIARHDGERWVVSTVFVGLPGDLFETIVFSKSGSVDGMRYATYDEAEAGHASFVKKYEARLDA